MQHSVPDLQVALLPVAEEAGRLGGTTGPDLSRYFLVCAILIAVTAGVAWGLKKLLAHNLSVRASQRSLKVLDVLGLGGKRQVAVVRCYDRTFVLGLGEREVSPIAELDPVVGATEEPAPSRPADRHAFAQALEHIRKALPKTSLTAARGVTPFEPAANATATAGVAAPGANAEPGVQPLPQDAIEPSLQAELERRYEAASARLAASQEPATAAAPAAIPAASPAAPQATQAAPRKRVLRKVIKKRSPEESERARSVASAAFEMAATMKRERAAAAAAPRPTPPAPPKAATADAVPAALPTAAVESPPTLRLEGILG